MNIPQLEAFIKHHSQYAELWQKKGHFDEYKRAVRVPYVDGDEDEKQLHNVFARCNCPDEYEESWTENAGLIVFEDNLSHSASVGDIIVLDKEEGNKSVYVIDNVGFTKINS